MDENTLKHDVLILGGGPSGLSTALGFTRPNLCGGSSSLRKPNLLK